MAIAQWKHIQNYEGLYLVSELGDIMALNYHGTGRCKILEPTAKERYLKVGLSKDGGYKTLWVHRLVAEAFCERPDEEHNEIDHIDGNKQNNAASNLRWVTAKENSNNPNTAHKGYHVSVEGRKRMSEGQKRRFSDPIERERMRLLLAAARAKNKPSRGLDGDIVS